MNHLNWDILIAAELRSITPALGGVTSWIGQLLVATATVSRVSGRQCEIYGGCRCRCSERANAEDQEQREFVIASDMLWFIGVKHCLSLAYVLPASRSIFRRAKPPLNEAC